VRMVQEWIALPIARLPTASGWGIKSGSANRDGGLSGLDIPFGSLTDMWPERKRVVLQGLYPEESRGEVWTARISLCIDSEITTSRIQYPLHLLPSHTGEEDRGPMIWGGVDEVQLH
jgi:hypothetical protein